MSPHSSRRIKDRTRETAEIEPNFTLHFTIRKNNTWARCTPCWTLLRNKFIGRFLSRSFFSRKLSPVQTVATLLLVNNSKNCWMLHVAFVCKPVCMLLGVIAQSLKPVSFPLSTAVPNIVTQQFPTLLARQCWELLANNVASVSTNVF